MIAMASNARATVTGFIVCRLSAMAEIFGRRAAGSTAMSSPSSSLTWLAKMITDMPAVKPTVTGNGIYLIWVPNLRKPIATIMTPAISVAMTRPS